MSEINQTVLAAQFDSPIPPTVTFLSMLFHCCTKQETLEQMRSLFREINDYA